MTDTWVPAPPVVLPPPSPGVVPQNTWNPTSGCCPPGGPSLTEGIVVTGIPATVSSFYWQVNLNDGSTPPNFQINQLDGKGNILSTAAEITPTDVYFDYPVMLSRDPIEDLEAATKEYVDSTVGGIEDAPDNGSSYVRNSEAWVLLPQIIPDAPSGQIFGRFNSTWAAVPIQADAPQDGQTYGRIANGAWNAALPLTGGTITGNLTVNQVVTVQGSNSMVLNAPMGNQRSILGMTSNLARWVLTLGDGTTEGLNNTGSNFSLSAYSTTGAFLGNWLTIARADGSTTFNGSGVTIQGGLAVNGLLALSSPNNLAIYGGTAGQFLSTNGAGILSWATPSGGGGASITVSDTPPASPTVGALWWDSVGGQLYVWYADANSSQWVVAVNAASLLPPASMTSLGAVKVDGTTIKAAADGTISAPIFMGDNRIINGDMRIDQRNGGATGTAVGYTIDRWQFAASLATKGTWQQGIANGPPGFGKFLAFASNSAYAPVAADYFGFLQAIEADMVTDFQWGSVNAQPVTLSFWAVSNLSGTFSGSISNVAVNRSYVFTYSLVANTWTKVVITIPGDTGGTWVMAGNAGSMRVNFCFGVGTTYAGPAGAWSSNYYLGATGTTNVVGSATGQFNLTGVKLEIGSVATPFNRQTMAKSLSDCLRYYQVITPMYLYGYAGAGNLIAQIITFPIMRATPTVVSGNASSNNTTTPGVNTVTVNSLLAYASIVTVGSGYWEFGLTMSAEL